MPTLEFKGKQHIYAHHLTVPHRPLIVNLEQSHLKILIGSTTCSILSWLDLDC